ncbi:helix-loop-helix protein 2-like [Emys orbicularis]|uniref:helix-loop-helix protein 2-like n=1 Tax=Emys orbicularis TaxID=82168 RepID=UPI0031FD4AA3
MMATGDDEEDDVNEEDNGYHFRWFCKGRCEYMDVQMYILYYLYLPCWNMMLDQVDFSDPLWGADSDQESPTGGDLRGDCCFLDNPALKAENGENARPGGAPNLQRLSREEKRRSRRATANYRSAHATRERSRVEAFNMAYGELRQLLPTLPPDKKLSKIEVLRLAICYISYLNHVLDI